MTAQSSCALKDNRYRCVFAGKNLVICTAGDTRSVIEANFKWARVNPGYDVLVTASRAYVGTEAVDAVIRESAKDGVYPHFITKMRTGNPSTQAIAEQQAIDDILTLIP